MLLKVTAQGLRPAETLRFNDECRTLRLPNIFPPTAGLQYSNSGLQLEELQDSFKEGVLRETQR